MMTHLAVRRVVIAVIAFAALLDLSANWLAAHVLLSVGPFLIPGGTFLFAFAFTTYDYLRRQYGLSPTLWAIALGFMASVLYSVVWGGGTGRIAIAGLIALACSSTVDLLAQSVTLRWPIWQYVGASNAVSLLVDTIVFATIAFATVPISGRLHIIEGQYLAKVAMTVVLIPLVYRARAWTERMTKDAVEGAAA